MKIGIIQQSNSADVNANRQALINKIKDLASQGAQLVVLPELHDSLYFWRAWTTLTSQCPSPAK